VVWQVVASGTGAEADRARAIVSDLGGDVVVVGQIHDAARRDELAVLKLAGASGAEQWRRLIDGPRSGNDIGLDVAFDGAGNVVVGGRLRNDDTGDEMAVAKLSGATGGSFPCGNGVVDAGETCDDGNANAADACVECVLDRCFEVECQPPGQCQDAACDPATGSCTPLNVQNGIPCDDADACTFSDRCVDGVCTGGAAVVCNDDDPCTVDTCESPTGCAEPDLTSFACPAIASVCPSLPQKIRKSLEKGETVGAKAVDAQGRRARGLLKAAIKAWRKAAQRAKRTKHGPDYSPECAAAIMEATSALIDRARDLRANL
jgi:cysteine-rich repeat protein